MLTISASDLTFSSPQSDLFPKCPYSVSSTIYLRPSRGQHFIVFLAIVYHLGPSFHTRVLFLTAERAHSLWIIPSSLPESCLPEARAISGDSSDLMMYRCRLSHPGTPSGTSLRNLSRTFSCCYCFIVHPQNSRFRNYITRTRVLRDRNCKRWLMRLYKSKLSSSLLLSLTGDIFCLSLCNNTALFKCSPDCGLHLHHGNKSLFFINYPVCVFSYSHTKWINPIWLPQDWFQTH